MAKSFHCAWRSKRAADTFIAMDSASCSSPFIGETMMGSPWPRSDHSFFSSSLGLRSITLLAAARMRCTER
ncbi:Uncharacterised protein [Bordetella pertussis]|nr:Uncharacterised protein [Bordetella pertussis]